MALDLLTFGEALVEIMRVDVDAPLDRPALFTGPYPSGAPFIFTAQAARLGAKAGCVGAVGSDAFGECMLRQLNADGIDTRGVEVLVEHATGVAFVAYQVNGARDFVFHARHSAAGQISVKSLRPELFEGLRCLHIAGSSLSLHDGVLEMGLKALEMAQAAGAKISFDPNIRLQLMTADRARVKFQPFMDAADVILPTADELRMLTGDTPDGAIASLLAQRPDCLIVVSAGAEGCDIYREKDYAVEHIHVPGFAVTEIDPTGAGDCFDAGFLVRWLAGDSPEDAARFGNACGALAVTERGPMAGAKTLAEVQAFMGKV